MHPNGMGDHMAEEKKPREPSRFVDKIPENDEGVVNDSFGTVDPADSSGLDEDKETGDAKSGNTDTHED